MAWIKLENGDIMVGDFQIETETPMTEAEVPAVEKPRRGRKTVTE